MIKKVWTNGCFDVIHRGHLELFAYAKSLGDQLLVGVDSDKKVKNDKGINRPFNSLEDRIFMLKSIKYIDEVYSFDNTHQLETLIGVVEPDIMVIGSDWRGKQVIGQQYTKHLKFFDRVGDYSTSKILGEING